MSIFWRLLRPEFVRERGTTLLGTTTANDSSTDSSTSTTITNTRIYNDGPVETDTTTTVTTPVVSADDDADVDDTSADTSPEDNSYVIIDDGDKFKVLKLLEKLFATRIRACHCC
jgi:hypothetical protein